MIYDVAISYAGREKVRLDGVEAALVSAGFSVWTDRTPLRVSERGEAERLVPAGIEHEEAIRDAIDHSATFVFLDSAAWRKSGYCRDEHTHACARGMRTISVGGSAEGRPEATEQIAKGDPEALADALRRGLEAGRAHARVRVAAARGPGVTRGEDVAPEDVATLAAANLAELGMSLSAPMTARMDEALERARRRRRRNMGLATAGLAILAVLATLSVLAWIAAGRDEDRAADTARHVESLAAAAASESTVNTFARLALARQSVDLEENPTTLAAMRTAIQRFGEGIAIRLDRDEAAALAVANDGDVATAQTSGAVTLVPASGGRQREIPADRAEAGSILAFSPDGTKLGAVRRDGGGAEIVEFETGRLARVAGTAEIAALFFLSERRAIAVSHEGEVLEFDPGARRPRARRLQWVLGPVRAATLASSGPKEAFSLATLVDGAVEVTEIGGEAPAWRAPLPLTAPQSEFSAGWESVRVCGGKLAVLAAVSADGVGPAGFGIPLTVNPDGKAVEAGSLFHSQGSICLPGGTALAVDFSYGQHPFPAEGPALPDFVAEADERVVYAIGSSENGQWAAAAGNDGRLKIVELGSYGLLREMPNLQEVAPSTEGRSLAITDTAILDIPLAGGPIRTVAETPDREAARGSYLDPRFGTVLAIASEMIVVRDGRVRERIPVGERVWAIHPWRPGVSALAVTSGRDLNRALEVPLNGSPPTAMVIPRDLYSGSTQLSDALALPGSPTRMVVAGTDGYLSLLAFPSGRELLRRRVVATGPISLSLAADGRLLTGNADGTVRLLDPRTLKTERSRPVFAPSPTLVATDASGGAAAAFGAGGVAVVLDLPSLSPTTELPAVRALESVAFDGDRRLVLGADLRLIGGGDEASVVSWPLCRACGAGAERLRAIGARLAEPPVADRQLRFVPTAVTGGGRR